MLKTELYEHFSAWLDALLENFEISTVLALGDIDVFLRTMKENGIIEE